LKNKKYRKSLTSILEVKESEKLQSGKSSFKSLVIELLFRAIRFFTPLQVITVLEIENLQNFHYFC